MLITPHEQIFYNPKFESPEYLFTFDYIEKRSTGSEISLICVEFLADEKVSKQAKLTLSLKCELISQTKGISFSYGKFIFGKESKTTKFKLNTLELETRELLKALRTITSLPLERPPACNQNKHCGCCEFESQCKESLLNRGHLSLLGNVGQKQIEKYNKKGIFTIEQLSYTYRNRKKSLHDTYRFPWPLKALAITKDMTYIVEEPQFENTTTEIFLDIEGLPQENFYYLIGVIVNQESTTRKYSFWADSIKQEKDVLREFLSLVHQFDYARIYHYGTYEITYLKKMSKRYPQYFDLIESLFDKTVNIHSYFKTDVFPPVHGNGLKDFAEFVGFKWSTKNANGLRSILWRKKWEINSSPSYKEMLLKYNIEDCLALVKVKAWLQQIPLSRSLNNDSSFSNVKDIKKESFFLGKTMFKLESFGIINKFAYFDYQRNKVFIRDSKVIKKAVRSKQSSTKIRVNKTVSLISTKSICKNCSSVDLAIHRYHKRIIVDLKFTKNGIKRWVIQYSFPEFRCRDCGNIFMLKFFDSNSRFGNNLNAWVINQYFSYNSTGVQIANMANELFNIHITSSWALSLIKVQSQKYEPTVAEVKKRILNGGLLHVDETRINIRGRLQYVWVFTNIDSVFYLHTVNRKSDFLDELLSEFTGVLVTDFYAGYDRITCPQQKCLIHLIRDLNDDLLKNQENHEFTEMVTAFGDLLKGIVLTVDRYGLKKYHLKKHNKDVNQFFKMINKEEFKTEIAKKYKKRFIKNENKLFTFINYDGVPWNNNNAEHAIKPFAVFRRKVGGISTENSIKYHLVLLSLQQTCKYQGISFLDFLRSGKLSLFD